MQLIFCAAAVICWQALTCIRLTENGGLELNVEADAELSQLPRAFPAELEGRFHGAAFLGAGLYGSVFRAMDTEHENIAVAVKVLNNPQTKCIKECSTVQNLMKACTPPHGKSCLGASHIVRCLEQSNPSPGISWMSTELVEGKDFNYYFGKDGLPPNWNILLAQQVIAQFVAALDFMERGGVSHADLTDHFGNVMVANLDSAPNLHIIDFGRAKSFQVSGDAEVSRRGNAEVRLWLWPLMILPSKRDFREGCLNPLSFEAHLATLLFDDSKPLSQTAVGSGITTDEMEILLLAADDEVGTGFLKESAQKTCHAIDGREPCPFPFGPKQEDVAAWYCNWPRASHDKAWLDDRWEKVCKHLKGGTACNERPAKDVATFVASVWTLMFKMQASIDEYWNACHQCGRKKKSSHLQQLCASCAMNKTVRDKLETQYKQALDCDDSSCTFLKGEEEVVKIEVVCTKQCKTYRTEALGSFDSIPCCVTPEIPEKKEDKEFEDIEFTTTKTGITMGTVLKAFPDPRQRGKLVEQMWQGLFSADGLSFLRKLIVDEAGVGVLIKEPFVSKMLATEPSTNKDADAYAAYPVMTCDDGVLAIPAKSHAVSLQNLRSFWGAICAFIAI